MTKHTIDDGTIEACQRGDSEAFRLVFEAYKDRVYSIGLCFFDGNEVFRWVGEVMLGTQIPRVIGEIPFLQKLRKEIPQEGDEEPGEGDFIGRIDNILVHPDSSTGLNWCMQN